jgi:hypothetical protein
VRVEFAGTGVKVGERGESGEREPRDEEEEEEVGMVGTCTRSTGREGWCAFLGYSATARHGVVVGAYTASAGRLRLSPRRASTLRRERRRRERWAQIAELMVSSISNVLLAEENAEGIWVLRGRAVGIRVGLSICSFILRHEKQEFSPAVRHALPRSARPL